MTALRGDRSLTATQIVFAATAVLAAVAVALVVAGVSVLFGAGWGLVAAGGLLGPLAVGGAWVLLRDVGPKS